MNTKQRKKNQTTRTSQPRSDHRIPFVEHLYELRNRLFYVVGSIIVISVAAYFVQQHIVSFILAPSHHQQFIYTSPAGGIGFLFQICTYVGIVFSVPLIIYQMLAFLSPIIHRNAKRLIARCSIYSGLLGIAGFCFGYYLGLPTALHFLGNQFATKQIHPLFTIQEYMSFVTIYLVGSVLLFQIPLIIVFINKIKPIQPKKLLHTERYVVVAAFSIAMLMAPTPNVLAQLIIAVPVFILYQSGIVLVWLKNKQKHLPKNVLKLIEQDRQIQAERLNRLATATLVKEEQQPVQRSMIPARRMQYIS